MRPTFLFLLISFFAVTAATAQLYDNRSRYLQTPYDYARFEKKPYQTQNTFLNNYQSNQNSYNNYRNRVNTYAPPKLDSKEFYDRFRTPEIFKRYLDNDDYLMGSPERPILTFQCFCFVPVDIPSLMNWMKGLNAELKARRQEIIDGQEKEYLKEMNNRLYRNYNHDNFKDAQKQFFKDYVQKHDFWYENGRKVSYEQHKARLLHDLKANAEKFDRVFERLIAESTVASYLKKYSSLHGTNLKKHFGNLTMGGKSVVDIPKSNYYQYDIYPLLMTVNRWGLKLFEERDVYNHFINSHDNLNDYLVDQYVNQYEKETHLEKRFALQSAYLIDELNGSYRPPSNKSAPEGFLAYIPYNKDNIMDFYRKGPDFTSPNSIMPFEKAKATVAIYNYPVNIKDFIFKQPTLKSSAIRYLENATPVNYELNTIKEAVTSRMNNKPFEWSELNNLPYREFQNSINPEIIMSINLKKRQFYNMVEHNGLDGSLNFGNGFTTFEYNMHQAIGNFLRNLYETYPNVAVEGATIRHFLKEKGLNVPSSLSNHDLGRLFDFGGGNTNTLTIEFSDYAKKYILNFHHGDGKYGTSLFTDLVKLKKLYDILKERPVDFSNNKKPCIGDPVPNPEIAPQLGPSGILGGMYGCTRFGGNCVGQDGRDKFHGGIDLKANYGDPIYAMYDGVVHSNYTQTNKAGYVTRLRSELSNGDIIIYQYFHLQKNDRLPAGTKVKAGDIIGYQGDSGNLKIALKKKSVDSHVHIKMNIYDGSGNSHDYSSNFKNNPVNPFNYMNTKFDSDGNKINNNCN